MPMIAFIDQKKQYTLLEHKIKQAMHAVLEHGQYILGPEVDALEHALAAYTGASDAIGVANGTDAITLCLMAQGVEAGDIVFVPEFTYCATAGVVARLGAIPYFVDIDPQTYTISPISLQCAIDQCIRSGRVFKGVITVDLFGITADYQALQPILDKYGLWLIQDAAQAFGATYHGQKVGAMHTLATTSFYPAKPLGCYGDGGAVFVNNAPEYADKIRRLRTHGVGEHRYDHIYIGFNSRLDTLQAAILLAKLSCFDDEVKARNTLAQHYNERLDPAYTRPYIPDYARSVYAQYCILLPSGVDRAMWQEQMRSLGIPTVVYYPLVMSQQKAYAHFPTALMPDSVTWDICSRIVALPMHGYVAHDEAESIIEATHKALHHVSSNYDK